MSSSTVPQMPVVKPGCANFGSGPCAKRPGHTVRNYSEEILGRSHRSKLGKGKLLKAIKETREILGVPEGYLVGIVPASDTGAVEMIMWSTLGFESRPVTCIFFDAFGEEWFSDIEKQLKTPMTKVFADYGEVPNLSNIDFHGDVIFTWNGTTSGVRIPNADWIPDNREGITICDATSATFAYDMPWSKLDVVTFSWQKVLGGEAAHGMVVLSPRAVSRIERYNPPWPLPKIFRLKKGDKINKEIFEGEVINTVSMLCVEDWLDTLAWARSIGGLPKLIERAQNNLKVMERLVARNPWISFLCKDPTYRSHTSVTFEINDFNAKTDEGKAELDKFVKYLDDLRVAFDIKSYRTAPPGIRIWCGATIETSDLEKLVPWLEWCHYVVKNKVKWQKRVVITDGLSEDGIKKLQASGFEVVKQKYEKDVLESQPVLAEFDGIIIRSATKLTAKAIEVAATAPNSKLHVIARAGVGVDNVDIPTATKYGILVINAPNAATLSVAELALGHLFACTRDLCLADRSLREGKWIKSDLSGAELSKKRIGFLGFGRIGQKLGELCSLLGMELHAFDPYVPDDVFARMKCTRHLSPDSLFKACTHISIHCNVTDETRNMVNAKMIAMMPQVSADGTKCGNFIVNCARGAIVNEKDALEALKSGKLSGLALDVFECEPTNDPKSVENFFATTGDLLKEKNFHGTPHIGASTKEAQGRVGEEIVAAFIATMYGNAPRGNIVNPEVHPKA